MVEKTRPAPVISVPESSLPGVPDQAGIAAGSPASLRQIVLSGEFQEYPCWAQDEGETSLLDPPPQLLLPSFLISILTISASCKDQTGNFAPLQLHPSFAHPSTSPLFPSPPTLQVEAGSKNTAWSSVSTLIRKELVLKTNIPAR